jgi:hypothetical protein
MNKVKRALALAKDNPNDNEGQTALAMAQRLMIKHDISMSEVSLESLNEKKTKKVKATDHKRISWWERRLAGIITDNFRCYYWWNTWERKSVITFMGLEKDVELAKEVYNLAVEAVKYYSKRFIKENDLSGNATMTRQYKNDYIAGFLSGLKEKFNEQIKENEEWGLIIQKDQLVVDTFEKIELRTERIKQPDLVSSFAMSQGYQDGKTIDHTRRKLD